ncbi:unnamed protein product [Acanthoscelides obtectus]|uniref:Uncharacterized protein n=1 Tax=Acanthoscelides obtectus TaxID=200917 RepID=A0A9P0M2M5_ACAOB|nr:unnamed protein product [Acanthoscelides obtectus]CAK1673523.1 hypothetical protein AOBTE_LOCUS29369 [Acanthoscelides obtectus]
MYPSGDLLIMDMAGMTKMLAGAALLISLLSTILCSVSVTWYGDEKIYCVLVTSCNGETHSKVKLLRGGAGHTFVDLEVHSSRGFHLFLIPDRTSN